MSEATTPEDAARKAREIAAKLLGTSAPIRANSTDSTGSGSKRKRWGVAPSALSQAAPTQILPGLEQAQKRLKESQQRRLWVSTTKERPGWHYVTYMRPHFDNIIQQVVAANPTEGDDTPLTIVFKGRGATGQPSLPGIPEEPLHVFLEGPGSQIEAAESQVEDLLAQAEKAEVTIDIEEAERMLDPAQNDRQLALTGQASASNNYRPATVAQLIGGGGGQHGNIPQSEWQQEEIEIPNGVVGFIIGRGGETITSMQARTGAKIQIQKEHDLQPGQSMRQIIVSGPTAESVSECKTMILSMVEDRVRAAGGSFSAGGKPPKEAKVQAALDQGHALQTVDVPDADVGLIIGKGGSTIQDIQGRTGASIQIPPAANTDNAEIRTVSITHPTKEGAQEAATMIQAILASKKTHTNNHGPAAGGQQVTIQVMIPDKDVGLCIGRQGCVIKEMQNKTRTRIQIPGQPTPGQPHRIATVSGPQEACEQVRQMIERIVVEQSSASVMGGGYGQPHGGGYHHQQQHAQAQPDPSQGYSAEWAAYYAAQQEAQQQQQQQQQQQALAAAATPAPAPGPAADAYYEDFFRYAYYYGEPAARQYYGAWSPPVGTPNPYGVNPDGVTAPPAGGTAAAPAPAAPAPSPQPAPAAAAPAPAAPPQAARETSVRKVSNLPAWMTRQQG